MHFYRESTIGGQTEVRRYGPGAINAGWVTPTYTAWYGVTSELADCFILLCGSAAEEKANLQGEETEAKE